MNVAGFGFALLVVLLVLVLGWSVATAARHAGLPSHSQRRLGWGVGLGLAVWLGVVALLAERGFFRQFDALPPRIPLAPLAVLAVAVLLGRSATFRRLMDASPPWWPIALQSFRVPVELLLYALHQRGQIPVQMTFEGRNFDILVGLTAPAVAWAVARGHLGASAVIGWNAVSVMLLINIVVTALTSAPGPLQRPWGGVEPRILAEAPFNWLPSFLVPLAVFAHVTSLRMAARLKVESRPSWR